jgi:uncharacterized protein
MRDDEFEWDDRKGASNERKHDVSFDAARIAFDDPRAVDLDDPDPDEERYKRLCQVDDRLIAVCYTERSGRIRVISARRVNQYEQSIYQNS